MTGGVRLGIIGTGTMAAQMAYAAAQLPDARVAAVLSRSADKADRFCAAHAPGARGCGALADLLDAVDAVYVATPAALHAGQVSAAIDAGKPVLCEKPLTGSAEQTQQVLAHAHARGVLVMEAIWTLALPAYRALKSRVAASDRAFVQFDFSYPLNAGDGAHYLDPDTGGVLLDRAVYGYAAAVHLLGDVTRQSAFVTRNAAGLDTSAELRLEHETGARALVTLAFDRLGPNSLHVSTERGAMDLGPSSLVAETLVHLPCPEQTPVQGIPAARGLKDRLKSLPLLRSLRHRLPPRPQVFGYGASCYAPVLQEFLTALQQGRTESALVPHSLSDHIARLTEDARSQA